MCRRKFSIICIFTSLVVLWGCAPSIILLHITPQPLKNVRPLISSDNKITLFLEPVIGGNDPQWYELGKYSWSLEKKPSILIRETLYKEFPPMGIFLSESPQNTDGSLRILVRWFGPYGSSPISAGVILAVELRKKDQEGVLWRGKFEGGVVPKALTPVTINNKELIEEAIAEALTEAITRLVQDAEFYQAISLLAASKERVIK